MSKLLQSEQEHQKKAFELYYAMGESRSYEQLALKLTVSVQTVKNWGRSFQWQHRIYERDAVTARQIADRTLHDSIDDYTRYKKIVRLALVRLAKGIADGRIRMHLSDLDRIIRLDAYLSGNDGPPGTSPVIRNYEDARECIREFLEEQRRLEEEESEGPPDHGENDPSKTDSTTGNDSSPNEPT